MKLSKLTFAVILAAAGSANAAVTMTGTTALTSDYMFRGISQSNERMAVQGSFTATHDSGFYVTAWGSSISKLATGKDGSSGLELDTLFGYGGSKGDLSYDVGVMRYNYPGADTRTPDTSFKRASYNEVYGSVTYKGAKLGAAYSDDYFAETGKFYYTYLDYTKAINQSLGFVGHVGYNKFDESTFLAGNGTNYVDYKVGLNTTVLGLGLEAAYIGSDSNAKAAYGRFAEGRAVVTLSKAF